MATDDVLAKQCHDMAGTPCYTATAGDEYDGPAEAVSECVDYAYYAGPGPGAEAVGWPAGEHDPWLGRECLCDVDMSPSLV